MASVEIREFPFGKCGEGDVKLYTLRNKNDFEFSVISYGASIKSIKIKDKNNVVTDVCLGLDTIEGTHLIINLCCFKFLKYNLYIYCKNTRMPS